jgi:hypothetical protein
LAITQRQAIASASDIPEFLNKIRNWLIVPQFDLYQIGKLHLVNPGEEVLVELLFQIGPCNDAIG